MESTGNKVLIGFLLLFLLFQALARQYWVEVVELNTGSIGNLAAEFTGVLVEVIIVYFVVDRILSEKENKKFLAIRQDICGEIEKISKLLFEKIESRIFNRVHIANSMVEHEKIDHAKLSEERDNFNNEVQSDILNKIERIQEVKAFALNNEIIDTLYSLESVAKTAQSLFSQMDDIIDAIYGYSPINPFEDVGFMSPFEDVEIEIKGNCFHLLHRIEKLENSLILLDAFRNKSLSRLTLLNFEKVDLLHRTNKGHFFYNAFYGLGNFFASMISDSEYSPALSSLHETIRCRNNPPEAFYVEQLEADRAEIRAGFANMLKRYAKIRELMYVYEDRQTKGTMEIAKKLDGTRAAILKQLYRAEREKAFKK